MCNRTGAPQLCKSNYVCVLSYVWQFCAKPDFGKIFWCPFQLSETTSSVFCSSQKLPSDSVPIPKTITEIFRFQFRRCKNAPRSDSVKCRFSVLNLKFDFISDGGCTREEQIQKALGSLPPCGNRCRFSESAICSSRVHPPSEIKSNFKFKTLRWRLLRWRLTLSDQRPHLPEITARTSLTSPIIRETPVRVRKVDWCS